MALVLFGAPKGTNVLIRLDDPSLYTDEGAAMPTPYFTSADVDFGPAGGEGRLRRITQAVTLAGTTTVQVTPVANGTEIAEQAESFTLAPASGAEQRIESGVAVMANRHAIVARVTALAGPVAFGECDLALIPRRSTENA